MIFERVDVEACKKTGKKGFSYEAVTFKRIPEEEAIKKGKGKGKKRKIDEDEEEDTWTYSMNTYVTPAIQKGTTMAMIKAGLTPFIPKEVITAYLKEHGCSCTK